MENRGWQRRGEGVGQGSSPMQAATTPPGQAFRALELRGQRGGQFRARLHAAVPTAAASPWAPRGRHQQLPVAGRLSLPLLAGAQLQLPHVPHHGRGVEGLLPLALGEVLLDLLADRLVDVLIQSCVARNPRAGEWKGCLRGRRRAWGPPSLGPAGVLTTGAARPAHR